jgi:hypothetical protein
MWLEGLRSAVKGATSLAQLQRKLPDLRRHLCDPPRRRQRQMAQGAPLFADTGT